jgi:hypothetical protein
MIRIASPQLGPLVLAGLRIGLATLSLALIMRALKHRWPWQDAKELLWIALTAVAVQFLLRLFKRPKPLHCATFASTGCGHQCCRRSSSFVRCARRVRVEHQGCEAAVYGYG